MPDFRQDITLPPVNNHQNVQLQRGRRLDAPVAVRDTLLATASREGRVKTGQAERVGPFLHLGLHVLAAPQALHRGRFLPENDLWQAQQLTNQACLGRMQSAYALA